MKNKTMKCVVLAAAAALLLGGCGDKTPTAQGSASAPRQNAPYAQAYIERIALCEQEDDELTYDLIDFDGVEPLELAVVREGMFVSLYTYEDGALRALMEHWPFGAMGNAGYEYAEGKNIVRNYNADLAGAVTYLTYYMKYDGGGELAPVYERDLSIWMFKDANDNGFPDEDEPMGEGECFYYGDEELTKEDYEAYLIDNDYRYFEGKDAAAAMTARLEGLAQ